MDIEFRHLRYFLAVANAGHMTRAAEQLGIQQPPLSMQIKALEKRLGLDLFHRRPRGMTLTDGGKLFEIEARRIVDDLATVTRRMAQVAQGERGSLKVGFTSSAAAHSFVPTALRAVRQRYPDVGLELSENNAADLTEALMEARLNCALLRVPVSQPTGVEFETLLREPVLLAVPVDHPLAHIGNTSQAAVSLLDLRHESFILVRRPGAPGLYANFMKLCEELGFRPKVVAEVPRMMTNLNLVAAGAGISVVPASMQNAQRGAVVYIALRESQQLDAPLTLAWRTEELTGPTKTFVNLLRNIATHYQHRPQLDTKQFALNQVSASP